MRIAVHAKVLSEERPTGIGVYTYNLLKALSRIDKKNEYVLYSNEPIIWKIDAPNFTEKILPFKRLWSYLRLPFEFIGGGFDLLFVPKEMVPPLIRPRTVVVCYDLMGLMYSERISLDGKVHFWLAVNYALKKADRVLSISDSTRNDVLKECGLPASRVSVAYPGHDQGLYRPGGNRARINEIKKKYGIDGEYVINTSSLLWYRKNIPVLIKAFHKAMQSHPGLKLVITGKKGEAYGEISSLISTLGLGGSVILTDYVPLADMPLLLEGALSLVFPSLHEGFGLPVVEAMACGCPVITSNVSALPEIAEGIGLLVDPASAEDIASAIKKVCGDQPLREQMRARGLERAMSFTWEATAKKTLEVFGEAR